MIEIIDEEWADDKAIRCEFENEHIWGMETTVNLFDCDIGLITNPEKIKQFVIELCDLIDMKRFGEPVIERFGSGELYGYSLMQLIHTSCITAHFAEEDGRIFLNIFSCKFYSPKQAVEFAKEYFKGDKAEFLVALRK